MSRVYASCPFTKLNKDTLNSFGCRRSDAGRNASCRCGRTGPGTLVCLKQLNGYSWSLPRKGNDVYITNDHCWLSRWCCCEAFNARPDPGGMTITILLGIAGSLVAGFLGRALGWYTEGAPVGFIASVIGAILLLAAYRALTGSRSRVGV